MIDPHNRETWKSLKILVKRDFALLWWGQLVSQCGNQLNYVALAWLVLVATGSTTAMGGVYLAQILPNALLGWGIGLLADRFDRRKLMIATDLVRGLLVLSLPVLHALGRLELWCIYLVTFLVSALTLLFYAAEKAVVPALVPAEDLTEANAFVEMTGQVANLAGPVAAGFLVAVLPREVDVLFIDAGTFLVSAGLLFFMRSLEPAQVGAPGWEGALAGVKFLLKQPLLRTIFLTATAANFLVMPFAVVFPVLSERVLGTGAIGFGWLMGGVGAGMLAGSLLASALARRFTSLGIIYGGMALLAASFALMSQAGSLVPAVTLAFLAGFGVSPANAVMLTMVQNITPTELQGRVFGSMFAVVGVAAPVGVGLASWLLEQWDARLLLLVIGAATAVVAVVGRVAADRAQLS